MSIATDMLGKTKEYLDRVGPAMTRLATLASALKMEHAQQLLEQSYQGLQKPEFRLIVLGRFKNGKSTFLNVLLGRLTQPLPELPQLQGGVLPMDDLPTTARLTTICYGEQPTVTMVKTDGTRETKSLAWFLEHSPLRLSTAENAAAFGDVQEFELTYPFENGRAGIVLLDSPGTDEDAERTLIARRALTTCDAAIMLFRTDSLLGQGELDFVKDMQRRGLTSFFTVINRWNGRPVDERLKHLVWDKRVTSLEDGPVYAEQDFAARKIYFVDARAALEAKLTEDAVQLSASGMAQFEQALHVYFEKERRRVQVLRWVDQADGAAQSLEDFITKMVPALHKEREEFQRKFTELRPQIDDLRRRKDRLPQQFAALRARCVNAVKTSFAELINQVRDALPGAVQQAELSSLQGMGSLVWAAVSRTKKEEVGQEVNEIALKVVEDHIRTWAQAEPSKPGVQQVLQPIFDDFIEDLKAEMQRIEIEVNRLHFELTGYTPSHPGDGVHDTESALWRRVFPAAFGLAFGPDLAILGATNGWKGMGRGIRVHAGAFGLLALLPGPIGWGAAATAWVLAFVVRAVWRSHEIEQELKASIIHGLIWGGEYEDPQTGKTVRFEGLRGEPQRVAPQIEDAVATMCGDFEHAVTEALFREIDQELHVLENMQRHNALNEGQKAQLVEEYNKALAEVRTGRTALRDTRRLADATL